MDEALDNHSEAEVHPVRQFVEKRWDRVKRDVRNHSKYDYPLKHRIFHVLVTPFSRIPFIIVPMIMIIIVLSVVRTIMVFPGLGDQGSFSARDDIVGERYDAYRSLTSDELGAVKETYNKGEVSIEDAGIMIFYEVPDGDIFQFGILKRIQEIEQYIFGLKNMVDFCYVPHFHGVQILNGSGCMEPLSVLSGFTHNRSIYGDVTFDINATLHYWATNLDGSAETARFFLDENFSNENLQSSVTRSMFMFGFPLDGFPRPGKVQAGASDSGLEFEPGVNVSLLNDEELYVYQYQLLTEWQMENIIEYLKEVHGNGLDYDHKENFNVYYLATFALKPEVMAAVVKDIAWMGMSVLVVLTLIYLQTNSFVLTFAGMFHIVASFPLSMVIYRLIYSVYPIMNSLAVFIILGIGADDIFVTVDAWKQSWFAGEKYLVDSHHQMAWVYRRAVSTMFITTLTTFMSFIATSLSAIPVIRSFGLFASLIVFFNFSLVITWYPSVITIWSHLIERRRRTRPWEKKTIEEITKLSAEAQEIIFNVDQDEEFDVSMYRYIEQWFYAVHGSAVFKLRWIIYAVFVVWFMICVNVMVDIDGFETFETIDFSNGVSGFFDSVGKVKMHKMLSLKNPPSDSIPMPSDSNLIRAMSSANAMMASGNSMEDLLLLFGVNIDTPIDRMDFDPNDADRLGIPIYNPNFNISEEDAQLSLKRICNALLDDEEYVLQLNFSCWILEFEKWTNETYSMGLPIPSNQFYGILFYWMSTTSFDYGLLENMGWNRYVGSQGNLTFSMRWTSVFVPRRQSNGFDSAILLDNYDHFEDFIVEQNSLSPPSLQGYQTSMSWIWMRASEILTAQSLNSIGYSLVLAYVCLLFATMNVMISTFAIVTIIGVVVSLISIMILSGWDLGVVESINITIFVGLSIDYVVHLANSYRENHAKKRKGRTKVALLEMGVSVLGGMMTSCSATIWLLCCKIRFFKTFGTIVFITIALSFLMSTTFFISLCFIVGPEGDFGDFRSLISMAIATVAGAVNLLSKRFLHIDLFASAREVWEKYFLHYIRRVMYLDPKGDFVGETFGKTRKIEDIDMGDLSYLDNVGMPEDLNDLGKEETIAAIDKNEVEMDRIPPREKSPSPPPPPPIVGVTGLPTGNGFGSQTPTPRSDFETVVPFDELSLPSISAESGDSDTDSNSNDGDDLPPPPAVPVFVLESESSSSSEGDTESETDSMSE